MLAKSLALIIFATIAVAEIPSYMKVCGRKNPNLDKCVMESVDGLRQKLREGIPELDVPPVDPLTLDEGFPISETNTLRASAKNVKMYGLSDFELKSFHDNLEEKTLEMETVFKKIILDADYDVNARILVPIAGKGPIHVESDDVHAIVTMKYKLVKRNGTDYMFFPTMTTKLTIKDYKADFKPVDGPDSPLATAINAALDGGRQEILASIRPTLERVISKKVLELSNNICKHFTYDELHPDSE